MFVKDASPIDKDQLRPSLRSRVSAFGAALKPKRHGQHPSAMMPSAPQSECSTLVDFVVEDAFLEGDDAHEFETEDYMLDSENSAWATGKYSVRRAKKATQTRGQKHILVALPETQMLSVDNSAWAPATPSATPTTTKTRAHFFSSSRKAQGTFGVEPEYLEPEDRAWM